MRVESTASALTPVEASVIFFAIVDAPSPLAKATLVPLIFQVSAVVPIFAASSDASTSPRLLAGAAVPAP